MPFGVYTYSYALNINNAINEANLVIKTLAPYKDKVKFPVIIDMEDADGYKENMVCHQMMFLYLFVKKNV